MKMSNDHWKKSQPSDKLDPCFFPSLPMASKSPYSTATYGFLITFIAITLSALLFSDKFAFLQTKTESTDATGKCPKKCCNACSLNLPLVLIFSAGLGMGVALLITFFQKEHRDKLMKYVRGSSSS